MHSFSSISRVDNDAKAVQYAASADRLRWPLSAQVVRQSVRNNFRRVQRIEARLKLFDPQLFIQDKSISPLLDENDRKVVASALEVAFLASLYANEGRPVEFVLAVVRDPRDSSDAPKLNSPEPLTPETLKVLSAALDPEKRCFVVVPDKQEHLKIHAISLKPYPSRLPGVKLPPLVVVDGPGRVALMINDKHVLYDRGRLRREDEDPLREWVGESTELIVNHVSTPTRFGRCLPLGINDVFKYDLAQWKLHEGAFRRHARDYGRPLLSGVLRLIAKWVKDARHGGALLLLPKGANLEEVASDGRWFRDGDRDLQRSVFKSAAIRSHLALALEGVWVVDDLRDEFQKDVSRWAREVINPRFNDALLNLDSACQRCARLTQVDGTTVLGSDLRVLGFGARLKASKPTSLPKSCEEFLMSRGNRHSSMAYTVACVDNALGIVVSQDGDAVAFYKRVGMSTEHRELIL